MAGRWGGAALRGLWGLLVVAPQLACQPSSSTPVPPALGDGFVVWESNRTGSWRLWTARLDGSGLRQLAPDEPGREHCCPQISPAGTAVAFLSGRFGNHRYDNDGTGELRLIGADGSAMRTLAPAARNYRENRGVVWIDDRSLIYIDEAQGTSRLDLESGTRTALLPDRPASEGWLLDATLRFGTHGAPPEFSPYDRTSRSVAPTMPRGGCQPYFSHDGRFGFWIAGAGGPIDRILLETGETAPILRKNDARVPSGRGYIYFPMIARSGELLVWGASGGKHSHFAADYDLFAAPLDPATLELAGEVVRLTEHPATDRYPDIWARAGSVRRRPPAATTAASTAASTEAPSARWPRSAAGLAWLFERGNRPNLVPGEDGAPPRAWAPIAEGRALYGRGFALDLRGGWFRTDDAVGARITTAATATNSLTIEATVRPASLEQHAPLFSLGGGRPGDRNFVLAQEGDALVLHLRLQTPAASPPVKLPAHAPARGVHVTFTYEPGRLRAYLDGERVLESDVVQGDFFFWKPRPLTIGMEAGREERWRGALSEIALRGEALAPEQVRLEQAALRPAPGALAEAPAERVTARLKARSAIPTLTEITPYREALAVFEYEDAAARRLRVAHFVLLGGESLPAAALLPGARVALRLEPFAEHPELESLYLSDDLPADASLALWFDPGF